MKVLWKMILKIISNIFFQLNSPGDDPSECWMAKGNESSTSEKTKEALCEGKYKLQNDHVFTSYCSSCFFERYGWCVVSRLWACDWFIPMACLSVGRLVSTSAVVSFLRHVETSDVSICRKDDVWNQIKSNQIRSDHIRSNRTRICISRTQLALQNISTVLSVNLATVLNVRFSSVSKHQMISFRQVTRQCRWADGALTCWK